MAAEFPTRTPTTARSLCCTRSESGSLGHILPLRGHRVELRLEALPRTVQPKLDAGDAAPDDLGHLRVRQLFEFAQNQYHSVTLRHPAQRRANLCRKLASLGSRSRIRGTV